MKNDKDGSRCFPLWWESTGVQWVLQGENVQSSPGVGDGGVVSIRKDFTEELPLTGRGFKKLIQLFAYNGFLFAHLFPRSFQKKARRDLEHP